MDADAIVVGGGLAGLVAAAELIEAGKRVILLDQEPAQSLGGQAFWSFGGLFFVDSPEQRRMRIRDSHDLALQDWLGSAGFDREEDALPRKWAEAYVAFAAGEKRAWLHAKGVRWFPIVGWAERGGYLATEHGNSVPRFHVTWGTGPGIIAPFVKRLREGEKRGLVSLRFRHRVNGFTTTAGVVDGVRGDILEESAVERGYASSRAVIGDFELKAQAIVVTSGGIGGNLDLVRKAWPTRLGAAAERHDLRRARSRRRAHARHHGGRRRQRHQPRPHVALHGGHPELEPDLVAARHPHPARSVVAVARRARASGCPCRCSPASTRWARSPTSWHQATSIPGSCSARRSSSASSRCPAPSRTRTSPAAAGPRSSARAEAAVRRRRCAPSWRRAPTSSSSATWPTSCSA